MILTIRKLGDPVLRNVSKDVDPSEISQPDFQTLIDDMIETMKHAGGVGLAAPQIGVDKRIFVLEVEERVALLRSKSYYGLDRAIPLAVWINPEIELQSIEYVENTEGCLSIDGYLGLVARYEKLRVSGLNREGKSVTEDVRGYHAKIVQHEVDHLNGLFYMDRAPYIYKRVDSQDLGSRYKDLQKS